MAGLYLHIPFCRQRCIYCDFYSTTRESECGKYVDVLCKEMLQRQSYLEGMRIDTVYIGGGTPSLLEEAHVSQLSATWNSCFEVAADAEITLEANPDDISPEYVQMLRRYSVNRISLGVQSFHEDTLRLLNRRHTARQTMKAVAACRDAGIHNISLDLIYGLPGETVEQWELNIEQALQLRPEHLSAYLLTYEEGTRLYAMRESGKIREMNEEDALRCYSILTKRLKEAGYEHYEISNFALPGYRSKHNSSYWKGISYLGCGPSAHSYNGYSREWNTSSLTYYINSVKEGTPFREKEELDLRTRYNDYIITRLRTREGMDLEELSTSFGDEWVEYVRNNITPWLDKGTVKQQGYLLSLSEEGVFLSDAVMSDLLYVD